jgi:CRISPR-associated protein Cas1
MVGRIVEIATDHRHISMHRGFLVIQESQGDRHEVGRVPLDDILAVIANAHGVTWTTNVLCSLAQRGAPFVLCGPNQLPVGFLLPTDGNFEQSHRIEGQATSSQPTRKRLWSALVKAKLKQQAHTLRATGRPDAHLEALALKVRSGDPENLEAQGAQRYWKLLFGDKFVRDRSREGLNSILNYGYTILRAAMARSVIAAGLHPSVGLHHSNDRNAMRLVDDLMEPFRPMVDLLAWELNRQAATSLTPDVKRSLVKVLEIDMETPAGRTPISVCMDHLATSLAQVFIGGRKHLALPVAGMACPAI